LTYAPIQSSRPELVSEGISKGILAAVGGITEGITAKYKTEQAKTEKLAERAHERALFGLKHESAMADKKAELYAEVYKKHANDPLGEGKTKKDIDAINKGFERVANVTNYVPSTQEESNDLKKAHEEARKEYGTEDDPFYKRDLAEATGTQIPDADKKTIAAQANEIANRIELPKPEGENVAFEPLLQGVTASFGGIPNYRIGEITVPPKQETSALSALEIPQPSVQPTQVSAPIQPATPKVEGQPTTAKVSETQVEPQIDFTSYKELFAPENYFEKESEARQFATTLPKNKDWVPIVEQDKSTKNFSVSYESVRKDRLEEEKKQFDAFQTQLNRKEKQQEKEEKKGEKHKLLQSHLEKFNNIDSAESTLNDIQGVLSEIGNTSGPMVGKVRQIIGGVGYDKLAIRLNNLVDSLTPGLARGVFGEVGVLTDEDVKRYKALIPNITRDPETAKILMDDLIRTLKERKRITINNLDKAGYDIKNFQMPEPTESEAKKQVEQNTDSVRTQMMSVLTQLRNETDPAKKQELQKQYNDLKSSFQSKQ
jgi:hypothetical protein